MKTYSKIENKSIEEIRPYWRNPRKNDKTVIELMKVIKEVGFNVPLLIDKDGVIIKGHSRYYAMVRLGYKEIPCIVSYEDDSTNNKNRIYDNAVQELSEWDLDKLKVDLEETQINLSNYAIPSLSNDSKREDAKKERGTKEGAIDVIMKYRCPCCGKEIMVSRNKALGKETR